MLRHRTYRQKGSNFQTDTNSNTRQRMQIKLLGVTLLLLLLALIKSRRDIKILQTKLEIIDPILTILLKEGQVTLTIKDDNEKE